MVRKKNHQAAASKMYRHFAVVTVLLTASVALFADGENAKAARPEVAASAPAGDKAAEPKLVVREREHSSERDLSQFYSDTSSDFSDTIGQASSSFSGSFAMPDATRLSELGMTQDQFEALSAQERAEALARFEGGASGRSVEQQQRRAAAASLRRSGGRGTSADY